MNIPFEDLLLEIKGCRVCEAFLPLGCNPLVKVHPSNKIIIIGQAPGRQVHENGVLWQDKSGDNLRKWLGINQEIFYQSNLFGLVPMGFCYPGKGKSGDLPPRPECAPLWHPEIINALKNVKLTLLVGQYAQNYYLQRPGKTLTDTVRSFRSFLPHFLPLPHPSPRNFIWQSKNPWFQDQLIPELQQIVKKLI